MGFTNHSGAADGEPSASRSDCSRQQDCPTDEELQPLVDALRHVVALDPRRRGKENEDDSASPDDLRVLETLVKRAKDVTLRLRSPSSTRLCERAAFALAVYTSSVRAVARELGLDDRACSRRNEVWAVLNAAMRDADRDVLRAFEPLIHWLTCAVNRLRQATPAMTAFRALANVTRQSHPELFTPGARVRWSAFSSATTSFSLAAEFLSRAESAPRGAVILRIEVGAGMAAPVRQYSFFPNEHEVLLPAGLDVEVLTVVTGAELRDLGVAAACGVDPANLSMVCVRAVPSPSPHGDGETQSDDGGTQRGVKGSSPSPGCDETAAVRPAVFEQSATTNSSVFDSWLQFAA